MKKIIEVANLSVFYGTIRALENASFYVNEGEIVAMIGPNGAGKSTALKSVCGLVSIKEGTIKYKDQVINGLMPDALVKKGLCLVPENRHIFSSMTILENLEMGAYTIPRNQTDLIKERLERVFQLFTVLADRKSQKAGTLSTGEQQMLAIGRALMLKPSLLLLDEPSSGLSPNFVELVFQKLQEINKAGTSILLVEQNASMALLNCHRGYVFDIGTIALEGDNVSLLKDERVKKILIG
ncbi:MAG: ABC transporter ATP-binding protein [bacterium]|nr:ABC transporter ATP-binding protein [bacterium]